jgi:NSS family neurotransmitter:Na+ symporter
MPMRAKRELWSGRIGFILANTASAVGLGSIWKFPYEVGANGGSAFVLFYLLGIALIVLPLMLAELALGRRGRSDAIRSILTVASSSHASARWARWARSASSPASSS